MIPMLNFSYTEFKIRFMKSSASELDLCNKPILVVSLLEGKFQKWFWRYSTYERILTTFSYCAITGLSTQCRLGEKSAVQNPVTTNYSIRKKKTFRKLSNYRKLSSRPVNKRHKRANLAALAASMSLLLACNDEKRGKAEKIVFPQAPTGNGSCALFCHMKLSLP